MNNTINRMIFLGYIDNGELWKLASDITNIGQKGSILWRQEHGVWFILDFIKAKFILVDNEQSKLTDNTRNKEVSNYIK